MPIEFDLGLTYLLVQLSCMKDLLISMPEHLELLWLKDEFLQEWLLVMEPMLAVEHQSWAH